MSQHHRYFVNSLPDYNEEPGEEVNQNNTSSHGAKDEVTSPKDINVGSSPGTSTTAQVIGDNSALLTAGQKQKQSDSSLIATPISEKQRPSLSCSSSPLSSSSSFTSKAIVDNSLVKKRLIALAHLIADKQKCSSDQADCDGGPYVGISGIAYMFTYLASSRDGLFDDNEIDFFHKQSLRYLEPALVYAKSLEIRDHLSWVAYLLGFAGSFAVAALVYHNVNDKANRDFYLHKYSQIASTCLPIHYLTRGSDELLVGRAGYICGATLLNKSFGMSKVVSDEVLLALALSSIKSGRDYATRKGLRNICPLMYSYYDTDYLGAAHGLAGILLALLSVPGILNRKHDLERDIKKSIDYLLSLQTESGNFPIALDELGVNARHEEDELVHWCHGAPGVVWLMARAYLIWKEDKYLDSCIKSSQLVWEKGLLRKGPGICHGIAGNALVFLLLYRLTGQLKYLHRANQFGDYLFTQEFRNGSRKPDAPYSLFEGIAGHVCFLADLLQPEKSHFPLYFDPFDDISILYKNVEPAL